MLACISIGIGIGIGIGVGTGVGISISISAAMTVAVCSDPAALMSPPSEEAPASQPGNDSSLQGNAAQLAAVLRYAAWGGQVQFFELANAHGPT